MKLVLVWMWESLENLPMLLGFVVAARYWGDRMPVGLAVLIIGMGMGVLITRMVEPKLHKAKHEVRWLSVLINFVLFVALAIPFVYYFSVDSHWLNWKTDILGGLVAGLFLTLVQSAHWSGPKSRMVLHGAAMMVSLPIIMLGLRCTIHINSWGLSFILTLLLALLASLIIALIDYREMYQSPF